MPLETKTAVRAEGDVEELVIAALRRLGRAATSAEIWRLIDAAYDVCFETRRRAFHSLLESHRMILEEHRDHRLPEPCVRLYRLGITTDLGTKGGTDARHPR